MNKKEAGRIAVRKLLELFNIDEQKLIDSKLPPPLVHKIEEVDEGWGIDIFFREIYYVEVYPEYKECILLGVSCSQSRSRNWYYPDVRFNPPNGHPPDVRVDFDFKELVRGLEKEEDEGEDNEDIPW